MTNRLPHIDHVFEQALERGSSEAHQADRLLEQGTGNGDLNAALHVSREEDRMLGWANLFCQRVLYGPRGELREGRER